MTVYFRHKPRQRTTATSFLGVGCFAWLPPTSNSMAATGENPLVSGLGSRLRRTYLPAAATTLASSLHAPPSSLAVQCFSMHCRCQVFRAALSVTVISFDTCFFVSRKHACWHVLTCASSSSGV